MSEAGWLYLLELPALRGVAKVERTVRDPSAVVVAWNDMQRSIRQELEDRARVVLDLEAFEQGDHYRP